MVPPPNPSPTFFIHPILFLIVSMFLCSWIFGIVLNNYNESLKEDWIKIWMNSDGLGYIWTIPPIFFSSRYYVNTRTCVMIDIKSKSRSDSWIFIVCMYFTYLYHACLHWSAVRDVIEILPT